MTSSDVSADQASAAFIAELVRWRIERGLSKKLLAAAMGFDASYVSHVEARRHRPTEDFARRAEAVLRSGGSLWERYKEYDEIRAVARGRVGQATHEQLKSDRWLPPGSGLVVEREIARLVYDHGRYGCTVTRALFNAGTEPITRFLAQISVDRYPGESARSNRHHHDHPLTWGELAIVATCDGAPMDWQRETDRDALKEVWLLFKNDRTLFPLYPGHRNTITYSWHVSAIQWGNWFERAIRLPTRELIIQVAFPLQMQPMVWGVHSSLSAEAPLRTPIARELSPKGQAVFTWHTDHAMLHDYYRLEWTDPNG